MASAQLRDFGTLLRRYRRAAGLTQEELAERAALSVRGISYLERGVTHRPYRDTVRLLADALQLEGQDRAEFEAAGRPRETSFSVEREAGSSGTAAAPGGTSAAVKVFLIADIRGYTSFTEERGDEAAAELAAHFALIARAGVMEHGGEVIELRGDEALAVFDSARHALQAALELQTRFAQERETDPALPLAVGIGLDAGESIALEGGYRGGALNLAARLCSLAAPGEVLATEGVTHLARKMEGVRYADRGMVRLKGFDHPVRVIRITPDTVAPRTGNLAAGGSITPPMPTGGFLGAMPTSVLVARQNELDAVMTAVYAVSGGEGRTVILVGEPGIGKTRLAQEVSLALRDRGFLVASGRCYEPHRSTPYYPFLEALTSAFVSAPPEVQSVAPQRWPYLGRLLPDQFTAPAVTVLEGQDEKLRLFRAVTSFLQEIAGTTPVAILLDDLHWADGVSVELLQHLARHTRAHPVLLLGTVRDTEVERQRGLKHALFDLAREQLAERINIRRLDPDGTAALISSSLGENGSAEEFATLVYRHTDGNPFFIHEVLQTLVERGLVSQRNGQWEPQDMQTIEVPESVRAAIEERVSRLDEQTRTVLYHASVLGHTFAFAALQAMCRLPEPELEHALTEAALDGVLREETADSYGFNHVLIQQALYAALPARRRRKLHLLAGEALEGLPEQLRLRRAAELASHFRKGGEVQRALTYSVLAGDQALSVFAHAEAEQFYRTALELAGEGDGAGNGASSVPRAGILRKLGNVLHRLTRYDEALQRLEEAATIYHATGDWQNALGVTAEIGSVHHVQGTCQEGIARLQAALSQLPTDRDATSASYQEATLHLSLAQLYIKEGSYSASLPAIVRAGELARESGDDRIRARVEAVTGETLRLLGRPSEALRNLEHAIELSQIAQDDETLFLALDVSADMCMNRGDLHRCKEMREGALHAAERLGDPLKVAFETNALGYACLYVGEWSEAVSHFEAGLRFARSSGAPLGTAFALFGLGAEKLVEGEWRLSRRYLEEGIEICEPTNNVEMLAIGYRTLAELDLLEGRAGQARGHLEAILREPGLSMPAISALLPVFAWCQLEMGDEEQAEQEIQRALRESWTQRHKLALVETLRVQGILFTRQRRWKEATDVLQLAISMARAMPLPYTVARSLRELGSMNLERRETDRAELHLQEALQIFRRLGASRDIESVTAMMDRAHA